MGNLFFLSAFLVSCTPSTKILNQESAWGANDESFVFWDNPAGNIEVYSLHIPSGQVINLTNNPGEDGNPVFSPDKTKLALFFSLEGNAEIFILNPDGTGKQNLTQNPGPDFNPSWSPDGTKLVFQSHRDGHGQIYVMANNGKDQINLSNNRFSDTNPAFSPNGRQIAFVSKTQNGTEIFLMDANGANRRQITHEGRNFRNPKWSPDGCCLVFHSDEIDPETGQDRGSIFIFDLENLALTELTDPGDNDYDFNPFFNSKGTAIAFNTYRAGKMGIHLLDLETNQETVLWER